MDTLRELGTFVGIPQGSAYRRSVFETALRLTGDLVSLLDERERISMRIMSVALEKLPPVTLDAVLVSPNTGMEPFVLRIDVQPTGTAILETFVDFKEANGTLNSTEMKGDGGSFSVTIPSGKWAVSVRCSGIGHTGFVKLERSFLVDVAPESLRKEEPPEVASPPPAQPLAPVTCTVTLDGIRPGSGGIEGIVVAGHGFLGEESVEVTQDATQKTLSRADKSGSFSIPLSLLRAHPPAQHTFQARGLTSARVSNAAGYTV
jgi:hypothetical protein